MKKNDKENPYCIRPKIHESNGNGDLYKMKPRLDIHIYKGVRFNYLFKYISMIYIQN